MLGAAHPAAVAAAAVAAACTPRIQQSSRVIHSQFDCCTRAFEAQRQCQCQHRVPVTLAGVTSYTGVTCGDSLRSWAQTAQALLLLPATSKQHPQYKVTPKIWTTELQIDAWMQVDAPACYRHTRCAAAITHNICLYAVRVLDAQAHPAS